MVLICCYCDVLVVVIVVVASIVQSGAMRGYGIETVLRKCCGIWAHIVKVIYLCCYVLAHVVLL